MIFKASKRSGGRQLGCHLLKTEENEHVEIHEVSGFISVTVMGAMNEAYAAARGTKCKQYLFSMSLSPPAHESVRVEVWTCNGFVPVTYLIMPPWPRMRAG